VNILAIDQGTSATKAVLVGPGNEVLGSAEVPVAVRAEGDAVEADPEDLYGSVVAAGREALVSARVPAGAAGAVALANQGETVLAWNRRTGRPLSAAIVWQDRRSSTVCARLAPSADHLAKITGLRLDPYFAAPKMTWLREQLGDSPAARQGPDSVITTTDTWLLARLGASYVTDAATASRTMLLDLDEADWSEPACAEFGIDPATLPRIADCAEVVGETSVFGGSLPVAGLAVDQQAALVGQRCLMAGQAKCTYGTGAFLLAATGSRSSAGAAVRSSAGLSASVAWRLNGVPAYCLDGQVYTAGAAVTWLTRLGLLADAAELDLVADGAADSGGVSFVPALAGLGAPRWSPGARGAFAGLNLGTTRANLVRAVVEGIAASVALLSRSVAADLGAPLAALRVDGGLTRSAALLQAQADLLGIPVEVSATPHATALGAAALARLGIRDSDTLDDAVGPVRPQQIVEPRMSPAEAAERLAAFDAAITSVIAAAR
jgi:glycerol kinase